MPGFRAVVAIAAAALSVVPSTVQDAIIVLCLFVCIDTFTGVVIAAKCQQLRSRRMREQLASKLAQYAGLIGVGGGAAVLSHQWAIFGCSIGVCISMEFVSILENVTLLEKCGGAPLGPARPLLKKLERFFAVPDAPEIPKIAEAPEPLKGSESDK